jgi:O-methyltransferase/methyltransferase family protein
VVPLGVSLCPAESTACQGWDAVTEQTTPRERARAALMAWRFSQAISVAAELGIPDQLAGGARSAEELAEATRTHAPSLQRLLRALAAGGILHEDQDRRFSLTDEGTYLRSDVPGSLTAQAIQFGRPYVHEGFSHLVDSIRTGESAFQQLHGEDIWSWRAHEPDESRIFDRAMAGMSVGVAEALADVYDFGSLGTLVDVGGGNGALLAVVLARHPQLRGVVFDQAHVVSAAREVLESAGVADRCEAVAGSFFDHVPGGDAHLMKSIIHDWADEPATRILQTIRAASAPGKPLLLVERVVGPPNEDLETKLSDLQMLVMLDGRERSTEEWAQLLAGGGYRLDDVRPITAGFHLLVAAARILPR